MKACAIIPARGGSKGLPAKNIRLFCGKPLIAWTIEAAKAAPSVGRVIVSTNDLAIAGVSRDAGAEVLERPSDISGDRATSEQALLHVLTSLDEKEGYRPDIVVFLQCTSPLREPSDIEDALAAMGEARADSLFSGALLQDLTVWKKSGADFAGLTFDPRNRGRRQDRDPFYLENGSIYLFRPELLFRSNNRLGGKIAFFEMPFWKSLEIDTQEDFELCETLFRLRLLRAGPGSAPPAGAIELMVYDFDGVMTDNRVLVREDGVESVEVNRADGLAVERIRSMGINQLILSTETNPVVAARGKKLGLEVLAGCAGKKAALEAYCKDRNIALSRVAFAGNDLNDLEAMQAVGWPVAPADAADAVRGVARLTTRARGGGGVVREIYDWISSQRPGD